MINTDGFFDETLSIQLLPRELEVLYNEAGWDTTAKFRVWSKLSGDPYRKKFAEVYLFSATGTDGASRNFGFVNGYGGKVTPAGEEPIISRSSFLGELDGVEGSGGLKYQFKVFPVVGHSVILYDDNGLIDEDAYTLDSEKGLVTFTEEPEGGAVTGTFALTDNAPELVRRMWYFTYEDFRPERTVYASEGLDESKLNGSGTEYTFKLRAGEKIKQDSVKLYTSSGGTAIDPTTYTVDYQAGSVTFNTSQVTDVFGDFSAVITPNGVDYGDIEAVDFQADSAEGVAGAAYSGLRLIFPSVPTAVSFVPDDEYGLGWGRSSQIYVWGNATKDRIVSYFRVDPAPDPEKTYFAPLYIGRLSTIGKAPRLNNVLIGGGREEDEITYTPGMKLGRVVVDYGSNTANGNSNVLLQQTIGGAMYQKHYLSFITHDVDIDTSNESRFNPSVYSGKYHISPMYIVHPSDGYVGRLDEVYAIHPKNISQLDELEVTETATNEHIGTGDGVTTKFHFFHKPVMDEDFQIQLVSDDGCAILDKDSEEITITNANGGKVVEFTEAPGQAIEVMASYNYNQVYRYTLADTPCTPFQLANISPYAPIGLGFLKENI